MLPWRDMWRNNLKQQQFEAFQHHTCTKIIIINIVIFSSSLCLGATGGDWRTSSTTPTPNGKKCCYFFGKQTLKFCTRVLQHPHEKWSRTLICLCTCMCACVYKLEGEQKPTDNKLIFTDGFSLRIASVLCYYWGLRFARWWITVRHNNLDIRCVIHQICCFTAAFVSVTIVGFPFELFTLTDVNGETWSASSILSRTRPRITAPWCKGLNTGVGSRGLNGMDLASPLPSNVVGRKYTFAPPPPIQGQTPYLFPL